MIGKGEDAASCLGNTFNLSLHVSASTGRPVKVEWKEQWYKGIRVLALMYTTHWYDPLKLPFLGLTSLLCITGSLK